MKVTTKDISVLSEQILEKINQFKKEIFDKFDFENLSFKVDNIENDEISVFIDINYINIENDHPIYGNSELDESERGLFYFGELSLEKDLGEFINNGLESNFSKLNIVSRLKNYDDFDNSLVDINNAKNAIQSYQYDNAINFLNKDEFSVLNSQDICDKFIELSIGQRGKPEKQMMVLQSLIGGGTFSYLLEHIGDLTHRISEKNVTQYSPSIALSTMVPKINNGIRSLSYNTNNYTIYEEVRDNWVSNYNFFKENNDDFAKKYSTYEYFHNEIILELEKYVQYHSELTVYNRPQWLSREAAINIGKLNFNEAKENLLELAELVESGLFLKKAMVLDPDYAPSIDSKKKFKP